jgi:hypothetical protein
MMATKILSWKEFNVSCINMCLDRSCRWRIRALVDGRFAGHGATVFGGHRQRPQDHHLRITGISVEGDNMDTSRTRWPKWPILIHFFQLEVKQTFEVKRRWVTSSTMLLLIWIELFWFRFSEYSARCFVLFSHPVRPFENVIVPAFKMSMTHPATLSKYIYNLITCIGWPEENCWKRCDVSCRKPSSSCSRVNFKARVLPLGQLWRQLLGCTSPLFTPRGRHTQLSLY